MCYSCEKSILRKNLVLPIEKISVSCTSQECNNVDNNSLSNFCLMICQVVAYGRLRTKKNFQLTALKVDTVAYERCHLQEVPNIVITLGNFWYFGKLVTEERWLLTSMRGGRNRRFNCIK